MGKRDEFSLNWSGLKTLYGEMFFFYIYKIYIPANKEAKGHLLKLSGIGPKVSFWIKRSRTFEKSYIYLWLP